MNKTMLHDGDFEVTTSSLGAELTSIKRAGKEYLWQADQKFWGGQSPILFPIVGNLKNDEIESAQGRCHMKRHGIARKTEHQLVEADQKSAHYCLESNDETRRVFPYDFRLEMLYTLIAPYTIEQRFRVTNTGSVMLPFVVGGHPAFNVPLDDSSTEAFEDYLLRFTKPWSYSAPHLDLKTGILDFQDGWLVLERSQEYHLNHEIFNKHDTIVFENVPGNSIELIGTKTSHGVKLSFEGFRYLGVWSAKNDAPFVAVEPWLGCASAIDEDKYLEHKRGMQFAAPGQTLEYAYSINVV